ncbi:embryogenesis-associated protein [Salix suchowensis]|nr:embryogenesis-associated protein [Salix suchowensis]
MEGIFYLEHDIKGLWDRLVTIPRVQEICVKWWQMLGIDIQMLIWMLLAGLFDILSGGNGFRFISILFLGMSYEEGWLERAIKHAILFEDMGGEYNIPSVAIADSVTEFDANPRLPMI